MTRVDAKQGSAHPSREWTFDDPSTVRRVLVEVRDLAPFPKGVFNCPFQFPVSYELRFTRGSSRLLTAEVTPTGCDTAVLDPGGTRRASLGFLDELRRMLGLSTRRFTGRPA